MVDPTGLYFGKPQLPQIYHWKDVFGEMKLDTAFYHACDLLFMISNSYDRSKPSYNIPMTFLHFEKYIYNILSPYVFHTWLTKYSRISHYVLNFKVWILRCLLFSDSFTNQCTIPNVWIDKQIHTKKHMV